MSDIRLYFKSSAIRDDAEFLCLTDMWRAAGSDESRRPVEWLRSARGEEFVQFVRENLKVGDSHVEILRTIRGGTEPATWAHWQLGMAYAQYLSPEFHAWCNDVVRKVMQGEPADGGALASVIATVGALADAVGSLAARMTKIENSQAALWSNMSVGGYIASGRFESLKNEWNSLITVEVAIGRWPSRQAARRDIMNELHDVTQWGGKCKPWHELPAQLETVARAVIKRRMKDAERSSKSSRQLSLIKTG